jgi:tellurite resistance protein TerC
MPVDVEPAGQALSHSGSPTAPFAGTVADVGAWATDAGERLTAATSNLLAPFLVDEVAGKPAWMWLALAGLVAALLAFDLGVMNRRGRELRAGESLLLSAFYVGVALAFGGWIWWAMGRDGAIAFLTGFLVEKSLAVDNVFVMFTILGALAIPRHLHQAVLFWGILGVIVLRLALLALGAALISRYAWTLDLFAVCLAATGLSMLLLAPRRRARGRRRLLELLRRRLRVTDAPHGARLFVTAPHPSTGWPVTWCTPLLLALVLILAADLVFAVDSVPAIFAISQDPFVVYSANLFAILGLRALYFKVAALLARFRYMVHSLALILVVIGGEVLLANAIGKVPPVWSLAATLVVLAGGALASVWRAARERRAAGSTTPGWNQPG